MHPIIPAYIRWSNLYKLVVFGQREDLDDARRLAWEFFQELRR